MMLRPQDVLVALKGYLLHGIVTLSELSRTLGLSTSEVHAATKRAIQAQLVRREADTVWTIRDNLFEFLIHGVKYSFPPERGGLTRGIATAYAAPGVREHFARPRGPVPVWPDPNGNVRGEAFSPLYRSVPLAAKTDGRLYNILALIDVIRGGTARERTVAVRLLQRELP